MNQKDLIKSILCARLGVLNTNDKIYARQCVIHEISKQEYKNFCNLNHIQGYKAASVRLGLYYNEKLVQIASFNKVRNTGKASSQNSKYEYVFKGNDFQLKNYFCKYGPEVEVLSPIKIRKLFINNIVKLQEIYKDKEN